MGVFTNPTSSIDHEVQYDPMEVSKEPEKNPFPIPKKKVTLEDCFDDFDDCKYQSDTPNEERKIITPAEFRKKSLERQWKIALKAVEDAIEKGEYDITLPFLPYPEIKEAFIASGWEYSNNNGKYRFIPSKAKETI